MLRVADHAARSDTGRQRPANEDSHLVRQPLFVLADGMGGAQAGEIASKTAVDVFAQGLPEGTGSNEERLARLVERANAAVHELAHSDEQLAGMGTTLTAAYLGERDLAVAHVGDSRFYLMRDGTLSQLTDDHSLVGELVRRGQLRAEEAEDHPQRSIITRALGIEQQVVVDHHTWAVRDGDVYLLCSDGLTSMVPDAKVAEVIAGSPSLAAAAQALVAAANAAGGRDNITVVLFRAEEVTPGPGAMLSDQATMAGAGSPTTQQVREAAASGPAQPGGQPVPAASVPARRPRSPRAHRPAGATARRRRFRPILTGLLVVLVLLVLVGSGAWIASRGVYFVATDDRGFVTLYQGLPYELPGFDLYQQQFVSGVAADSLPPTARRVVTDHKLRSYDDAVDLVRQIERGELAGQR